MPRGGSKKGRTFQRIKRAPGDELRGREMYILDSEFDFVRKIGKGNFSAGIRKLIAAARSMTSNS